MLHAECKGRPLGFQDEMTIEPCSKKSKSRELYEKSCDFPGYHGETGCEKALDDWTSSSSSEQGKDEMTENTTADISNDALPSKRQLTDSVDSEIVQNISVSFVSVNDTQETRNKYSPITDYVDRVSIKKNSRNSVALSEREVFATSKTFIGPLYKSAKKNKQDESRSCAKYNTRAKQNASLDGGSEKEAVKTQNHSTDIFKIDDELCQFYREIQQLESDKDELESNLQETEAESSWEQRAHYKKYQTLCADEQDGSYSKTQSTYDNEQQFYNEPSGQSTGNEQHFYNEPSRPSTGNEQYFYNKPSQQRTGNEQCFYNEPNNQRTGNEQRFDNETSLWKPENPCNRPDPKFWNDSFPQFRPGWQQPQSFIVPQCPLPPRFNYHLNFQAPNSLLQQQNTFHPQNDGLYHKNYDAYHGNNGNTNQSCPLSDQNSSYPGPISIHNTQPTKNGYNDHNGHINNGFSETRVCWKETKTYQSEEKSSFSGQQFPEEKLCRSEKLLQILRGLPGSGKTTLSRILLDQRHDGIVFSTDDYFRQQDGYTYIVGQLGAAHDWNQKRAKQAMEEGRSPIIIDNTNTQAWEMKPYVQMALGKGYQVEFHEPDTWWKFDPEELEKRNKHGVPREKIAQMLERYEYQMSISIVMNSVDPPHKNVQRPPPQRRQREADLKKRPGHRLSKARQRKKRKRDRKMKSSQVKVTEKKIDGVSSKLIPDDQESSESEEEVSEEENKQSAFAISGSPGNPVAGCENGCTGGGDESLKSTKLQKASLPVAGYDVSATLDSPLKTDLLAEDVDPFLINLKSIANSSNMEHSSDQMADQSQHKRNDQNSVLKVDNTNKGGTEMLTIEDKLLSDKTSEPDPESKLLNDKKEETLFYERDLKANENCVELNDKNSKVRHSSRNAKGSWGFSIDLASEDPQVGSDSQASLSSWSESTHTFIREQKPEKVREPRQAFSACGAELTCYKSNEEVEKETISQTLTEESYSLTDGDLPLSLIGNVQNIPPLKTEGAFTNWIARVNVQSNLGTPASSKKKGRCKKTFRLAPNFHIPRESVVGRDVRLKDALLRDCLSENVLKAEQGGAISEDNKGEDEQNFYYRLAPSSNGEVPDSLPPHDEESLSCNTSDGWLGQCTCLSKKAVYFPVQKCAFSSYEVSSTSAEQIITSNQQAMRDKDEGEAEQLSSEVSASQPNSLYSVNLSAGFPTVSESHEESIHKTDKTQPSQYFHDEEYEDLLTTKTKFLRLPLSLIFAFQLVELFGSPGVPLDTLLPEDYIVPLDGKILKTIYLLWKTSVKRKQKKNGLQNENSLPVGETSLENTNEGNCQESQESSGTHTEASVSKC
uniref:NEDD4-binding protein 2-like 2 n=1 Tax=Sphenodon punctatus TaxID=8508 RepID=A0A8D0HAG2_SPHPU